MRAAPCPGPQKLHDYASGWLDEEEAARLEEHLNGCPGCLSLLATAQDAADTLVSRLRRAPVPNPYEQEPGFRQVLARARAAVQMAVAGEDAAAESGPAPAAELRQIGDYQLLGKLGQGGMGTVYRALQVKLGKTVALKVLPPGYTQDARAVSRFEREMKAIGRLNHPNIIQAFDAREIEGTSILVMEYVEGQDLARLVRHRGPLAVSDACELVRQTAVGLQYVHENGLVHRDIKPSNLMLARGPQVKILDLGLALLRTDQPGREMTNTGQAVGSVDYMAPEQIHDSHHVDIRADIYSLGCTLYKLLAGRAPVGDPEHKGAYEKMTAQVQNSPTPIRQLRGDVPAELAAVLDRMLAKNPGDRYAMPREVAEAVAPFAEGSDLGSLLARPTSVSETEGLEHSFATAEYLSSSLTGTQPNGTYSRRAQYRGLLARLVARRQVRGLWRAARGQGQRRLAIVGRGIALARWHLERHLSWIHGFGVVAERRDACKRGGCRRAPMASPIREASAPAGSHSPWG